MVNSGTLPVSGRVAVVIGGTSGIGRELALGLVRADCAGKTQRTPTLEVNAIAPGVFRTAEVMVVDGGFLASGVNQ